MNIKDEWCVGFSAVTAFGKESQIHQLQEECAELIVAASHYLRGRDGSRENFIEELADVSIMVGQMIFALSDDNMTLPCIQATEKDIKDVKDIKLRRLKESIDTTKRTLKTTNT